MTDKTNEEKLRILQERLSVIKQKETTRQEVREEDTPAAPIFEENLASKQPKKESNSENNKGSFWKIIFFLIFFSFLGGFGYYFSTNDFEIDSTLETIKKDVSTSSEKISSLFGKNKKTKEGSVDVKGDEKAINEKENEDDIEGEKEIKYNFNMPGEKIAIIGSFENEHLAKRRVKDLKRIGDYKCDYFFLPDKSNSKEEIYKVFIGPYETEDEANQDIKPLKTEFEIINL
tara:strand:+ start:171 stop:863 length:693 start_codon:yes stop_codon:yes gene_type:complete